MCNSSYNKAILVIGSNHDATTNSSLAIRLLTEKLGEVACSRVKRTKAINFPQADDQHLYFQNQVLLVSTELSMSTIHLILKDIEKKIGRQPEDKEKGIVLIDIDLVQWNEQVLKSEDLSRSYVQEGLEELGL